MCEQTQVTCVKIRKLLSSSYRDIPFRVTYSKHKQCNGRILIEFSTLCIATKEILRHLRDNGYDHFIATFDKPAPNQYSYNMVIVGYISERNYSLTTFA